MIFDDNFVQLTEGRTPFKSSEEDGLLEEPLQLEEVESTGKKPIEYITSDKDYVIESDLVIPTVEMVKKTEKPLIVVVDDDFDTLDLMKIFLSRDYEYEGFSGPREAVFYLNTHNPALVMIDCKIHTMKASSFASIVRSGQGNENVPIVYTGTEEELSRVDKDMLPDYIKGFLMRPVARGQLQEILDSILG